MDTQARTLTKAVTWQLMGLLLMTLLGFAFTGSLTQGGSLAIITALISLCTYVLHERAWARVRWGRRPTV